MNALEKRIAYIKKQIEIAQDNETLALLDVELTNAEDELILIEGEENVA